MAKSPIWKSIADRLRAEIGEGHYSPGDKLPTEAALAARFGVNRHTVRRALADMAEAGQVHSRRGAGVFVAAGPTEYPIGRRVRFHQNLVAAGTLPEKRVLRVETRAASQREADLLNLPPRAEVHVYEGLSLADGVPVAHFESVFPADRFPDLPARLQASGSVTAALAAEGLEDYTRATTRLTAVAASPTQALHLRLAEGAPILRTQSVNIDPEGRPVESGQTWFAGDRIALTVTPD